MDTREVLLEKQMLARSEVGWAQDAKNSGGPDHVAEKKAILREIDERLCIMGTPR